MSELNYTVDVASNLPQILLSINQESNGWFIGLLMMMIWLVLLSTSMLLRYPFNRSLVFSNFLITILAVLFWVVGAISITFMVLPVVLLMISIGFLLFGN